MLHRKSTVRQYISLLLAGMSLLSLCACVNEPVTEGTDTGTEEVTTSAATERETDMETESQVPDTTADSQTEALTEVRTEASTEPETEPPVPVAGENSGLVRDGTPKKYFTLSFDDGITQDLRIIEIMKKYNMDCITFNINTGLYGANWTWVADALNSPGLSHLRFTKEELSGGIYDGFDVEVHTLMHGSLKNFSKRQVTREVAKDAENITAITGIRPIGMAYPGGDTEYTESTIDVIMETTDIRFGRGITSTYDFGLPTYFMQWQPTCSFSDARLESLVQSFLEAECTEDMLFYVWGHAYELDAFDSWDRFESFIKTMSEAEDVVCVTNAEFYQLFKDEIPSWKYGE